MVIFNSYVSLPEGISVLKMNGTFRRMELHQQQKKYILEWNFNNFIKIIEISRDPSSTIPASHDLRPPEVEVDGRADGRLPIGEAHPLHRPARLNGAENGQLLMISEVSIVDDFLQSPWMRLKKDTVEYGVYSNRILQLSDFAGEVMDPLWVLQWPTSLGQILFQLLTLRGFAAAIQTLENKEETTRGGGAPGWLVLAYQNPVMEKMYNLIPLELSNFA